MPTKLYAQEYACAILKNLNREWATKQDFWAENAIAFLSAIIWFLKKHHPKECSLPHATLIGLHDHKKSIELLSKDDETKKMIAPIEIAYRTGADDQLSGIFASMQLPLNKIYSKEIFWTLCSSPNEESHVDLDITNPLAPMLLTVANDPKLSDSFSPVIALATVCMKNMNQQGKQKSIFLLDEAPTLFIPGLENLPATARSNRVSTIICVQDFAQLQKMYGSLGAKILRANLGTQFFGATNNLETGEYVSKLVGYYEQKQQSLHTGENSQSRTFSSKKEKILEPSDIINQSAGSFIIKLISQVNPLLEVQILSQKENSVKDLDQHKDGDVLAELIEEKWTKIHQEVDDILELKERKKSEAISFKDIAQDLDRLLSIPSSEPHSPKVLNSLSLDKILLEHFSPSPKGQGNFFTTTQIIDYLQAFVPSSLSLNICLFC